MTMPLRAIALALTLSIVSSLAQPPEAPPTTAALPAKLLLAPTSTDVMAGKASLTLGALSREGGAFVGQYQLKVTPYFFKNEKGKLTMNLSDESLLKLAQGEAVNVTGKAVTDGSGKTRPVVAKATPSAEGRGSVTFSFTGEKTKLTFNTTYRFGDK